VPPKRQTNPQQRKEGRFALSYVASVRVITQVSYVFNF
jgi:hypothetical protein